MKTIKATALLLFPVSLLVFAGCATETSTTKKMVKKPEVFRDGQIPTRPYKVVKTLTDDGRAVDQGEIEEKFIRGARKQGADAVIIYQKERSGTAFTGFGIAESYLYRADIVVYE